MRTVDRCCRLKLAIVAFKTLLAVGLATLVLVAARGTIDRSGASERAVRSRGTG